MASRKAYKLRVEATFDVWQINQNRRTVIGMCCQSNSVNYMAGVEYVFIRYEYITNYPQDKDLGPHFLIKLWTGEYFMFRGVLPNE